MNLRLLRNRNFMALWIGQLISFVGDYFNYLAVPIAINRLTQSPGMVGLSFISTALPALVLGPVAGVFVDRWDRRKVMIASDVLRGLLVLALLTIHDASQVWVFYLIGFLNSCTSQFFFPSRGAVLPLVVTDPEDWLPANGMMQVIQMVGMVGGPALAGFAIGLWGERAAFIANSIGYFSSALAVMTMQVPHTTARVATEGKHTFHGVLDDLRDGLAYLFGNRSMVGLLICMTVAFLGVGAINVIWVPYLQRTFNVGASGLGMVDSAQGVGMIIGGLLLGVAAGRIAKTTLSNVGLLFIGGAFGLMGFMPAFGYIMALNFIIGLLIVSVQSSLSTIMQLSVPDLKRGRVGSSLNAINTAGLLLSMAFASLFGETVGLRYIFVIVGVFVFLSGFLGFWLLHEPERPVAGAVYDQAGSSLNND